MKILFYMNDQDYRYNSLTNILQDLDSNYSVGICDSSIKLEDVVGFKPDVVIHNKPNKERFPFPGNFISININETNSDTSFSMRDPLNKNYIEPCCVYSSFKKSYDKKFVSKSVYVGDPSVFRGSVKELIANDVYGFKFFLDSPASVLGYSGACTPQESLNIYSGAKCCLLQKGDVHRYRDVLCSGGNPVEYDGDDKSFLKEILSYIDGKDFNKDERREVLSTHTDYDRLSYIFTKIGLKKTSDSIKALKIRKMNENNAMS